MRIYLDTCSLQRPLDDRSQLRIAIEAEAILGILTWLSKTDTVDLISSDALLFETKRIPNVYRKHYVLEVLEKSNIFIELNDRIEMRARVFHATGIKPLDALHLAYAEVAKADYFCTCDDKLLKKAKILEDIETKVISPLELIIEVKEP